jgi:Skp family chaperone for outer membrane proteins
MKAKLFINYRREDTAPYAGRLYDRLITHFGEDQVFIDIDQIEPGEDFVEVINRKVGVCDIAIVAIGPNWLSATDASGKRRIDDEEDFVRMEIAAALQRKIRVIPVLVGGARMPAKHDLPEALAPLSRRNAIELSETRFHADVNRLIEAIEKPFATGEEQVQLSAMPAVPPPEPARRPPKPESKDTPEPSESAKPTEPSEPKGIDARAVPGPAPVWTWERRILVSAFALLLVALAGFGIKKAAERNRTLVANLNSQSTPAETQLGVFNQAEKKPSPPSETVTSNTSPTAPTQLRATESESARTAETPAETQSPWSTVSGGYDPAMSFIDMQKIFKEYNRTKDAELKINDAKNAAKKEYDDRAEAYKKALDEINNLNKQLESPALSADEKTQTAKERDDKIANIKTMEREIKDWRQTREKQLQEQLMSMREGIVKEITGEIRGLGGDVANIIFDKSGMSINGVPVLIYSPDRADMSDRVIRALNDGSGSTFTTTRNMKMAAIDMQRAFKEYNKTKDAESKINDAKNAAKKEYDDRAEAYKKALDDINNLNKRLQSRNLSPDTKTRTAKMRDNKIANIKNMEREINDFRQTRERQLQEQLMRMRKGIVKEITDVVMNAVKANDIGVVLDISGMSSNNGVPVVLYRHGIPDFTDEAVAKLNGISFPGNVLDSSDSSRNLRFAVVDMHRAFEASPDMKATEAKISDEKASAKNNYSSQSPAEREKRDKQIEEDARKLKEPIIAQIGAAVSTCAERAGFNLVFDSSGNSFNGVPVIVFARDLPDLTDAVLKEYDRSH